MHNEHDRALPIENFPEISYDTLLSQDFFNQVKGYCKSLNLIPAQFLLHSARLIHESICQNPETPLDLFVPSAAFRKVSRKEIMLMHQADKKGKVDQWGALFGNKKKFRQLFNTNVIESLSNENLISLIRPKGKKTGWDGIVLTIKGWLVSLCLEKEQGNQLSPCTSEYFLDRNYFSDYFLQKFAIPTLPLLRKNQFNQFKQYCIKKHDDLKIMISQHNDGSSAFLQHVQRLWDDMVVIYLDLPTIFLSSSFQEYLVNRLENDFQDALIGNSADMVDDVLDKIASAKSFTAIISSLHKLFKPKEVIFAIDHADILFLNPDKIPPNISKLFKKVLSAKKTRSHFIFNIKSPLLFNEPNGDYFIFPPISRRSFADFAISCWLKNHFQKLDQDYVLGQLIDDFQTKLLDMETISNKTLSMNSLMFLGFQIIETPNLLFENPLKLKEIIDFTPYIISILETSEGSRFFGEIMRLYEKHYTDLSFPSFEWSFRDWIPIPTNGLSTLIEKCRSKFKFILLHTELCNNHVRITSDETLRKIIREVKTYSFSPIDMDVINKMSNVKKTFKSWESQLVYFNPYDRAELEELHSLLLQLLGNRSKMQRINLEHCAYFTSLLLISGTTVSEQLIEATFPYLEDVLMETLSLLQTIQNPIHEKTQLLETFSINLLELTQSSRTLRNLAGSLVECFVYLPDQYFPDLVLNALTWHYSSNHKMMTLIDFIISFGEKFNELLYSSDNTVSFASFASKIPRDELNHKFVNRLIMHYLNANWSDNAFYQYMDLLLKGEFLIEPDLIEELLHFVESRSPSLKTLMEYCLPQINGKLRFVDDFPIISLYLLLFDHDPITINSLQSLLQAFLDHLAQFNEDEALSFISIQNVLPDINLTDFYAIKIAGYAFVLQLPTSIIFTLRYRDKHLKQFLIEYLVKGWKYPKQLIGQERLIKELFSTHVENLPIEGRIDEFFQFLSIAKVNYSLYPKAVPFLVMSFFPKEQWYLQKFLEVILDRIDDFSQFNKVITIACVSSIIRDRIEVINEFLAFWFNKRTKKVFLQIFLFLWNEVTPTLFMEWDKLGDYYGELVSDFAFLSLMLKENVEFPSSLSSQVKTKLDCLAQLLQFLRFPDPIPNLSELSCISNYVKYLVIQKIFFDKTMLDHIMKNGFQGSKFLTSVIDDLVTTENLPHGFLMVIFYRLLEGYLQSLLHKVEITSIAYLSVLTHAFSNWLVRNPQQILNSMKNMHSSPDENLAVELQLRSFLSSSSRIKELFHSLPDDSKAQILNFLKKQSWYIQNLYGSVLEA